MRCTEDGNIDNEKYVASTPAEIEEYRMVRCIRARPEDNAALVRAVSDAARGDGLLLCPEGGATVAAWRKALAAGLVGPEERIVLFNCASGLKYPMPAV